MRAIPKAVYYTEDDRVDFGDKDDAWEPSGEPEMCARCGEDLYYSKSADEWLCIVDCW